VGKLRQLLLSDDVRRHIDYVSDKTSSSSVTWERLFSQAATLVFREVDHRVKPSTSRKSLSQGTSAGTSRRSSSQGTSVGTKVPVIINCTVSYVMVKVSIYL